MNADEVADRWAEVRRILDEGLVSDEVRRAMVADLRAQCHANGWGQCKLPDGRVLTVDFRYPDGAPYPGDTDG